MLIYLLIAGLVATSCVAMLSLLVAGYFYGENRSLGKWIIENRRREHRAKWELRLWQVKLLEKAGIGPLVRPVPSTSPDPPQPKRRIVSASQAISEMKSDDNMGLHAVPRTDQPKVPPAIADKFLNEGAVTAAGS